MTRSGFSLLMVILLTLPTARAAETNTAPDFKEVFDLVRQHLTGLTEAELNRAAVEGLFNSLRGKVTLVSGASSNATPAALVSKCTVLENDMAYVRIGRVEDGLKKEFESVLNQVSSTNKLKGVVLDLRFAGGRDYATAASLANLFIADAKPLLDWGNGIAKSDKKFDVIKWPAAILVNHETSGAAEALAAVLRESGAGLILGSTTSGTAMIYQEFTLKDGQRLRIATLPVKLGDGTELSAHGIKPDIEVLVTAEDERAYFEDAYARLAKVTLSNGAGATNQVAGTSRPTRRPRPSEADLVRARREGTNLDADSVFVRDSEPERPIIQDPALARAVDLLKGLAVVRRTQP